MPALWKINCIPQCVSSAAEPFGRQSAPWFEGLPFQAVGLEGLCDIRALLPQSLKLLVNSREVLVQLRLGIGVASVALF